VLRYATLPMLLASAAAAAAPAPPALTAGRAQGAVTPARLPDGGVWRHAGVIPDLVQQQPDPGAPTAFTTRVRVLRTRDTLYVAVHAVDPHPSRINVHGLSRDATQKDDDHVTLVIDPRHRGRQAFVFQVNARGARRDGLISPASSHPSWNWNGIWNARAWRTRHGWSVLIRIPVATLRFDPGQGRWGFNVARYVPRRQLTLTWAGHTLDSSVYNLRREGTLAGMSGLETGLGLRATPYVLASESDTQPHFEHKAGATVTAALTPGLTGALTVRPDFAEAEAEHQQLNLSPYPQFLPEKRRFFLEGSNLFTFSAGLGHHFIPFYSRRVGLVNGQVIPIDAGAKLVGDAGPVSMGALDVQTASSAGIDSQNLFAGRAAWDVGEGLTVGTLVTHGNPTGAAPNTLVGTDAVWQTSSFAGDKNFEASAWGARSAGSRLPGNANGWGARVAYPNDLWDLGLEYEVYGNALDPALGFLPRPGTRQSHAWIKYQPRPDATGPFGWARQFFYQAYLHYDTDISNRLVDWRAFLVPFNVKTESGAHYEVDFAPHFQRLDVPFNVADDVYIPAGDYRYNRYEVQVDSPGSNQWQVGGNAGFGTFYDGRLKKVKAYVSYATRNGRWKVKAQAQDDFGRLPAGNFVVRLYGLRVTWAESPDVTFSSLSQYDTVSHQVAINGIFRWIIRPGSDLYVVLDHNVPVLTNANPAGGSSSGNIVTVKLAWTFDS